MLVGERTTAAIAKHDKNLVHFIYVVMANEFEKSIAKIAIGIIITMLLIVVLLLIPLAT